jgi:hypothetical protein
MAKRAEFEIPPGLQELARQFEEWRSAHSGRQPIPKARAAVQAREHGVFGTAKVLRLDFSKLKRQMVPAQAEAKAASSPPPAFLKVDAEVFWPTDGHEYTRIRCPANLWTLHQMRPPVSNLRRSGEGWHGTHGKNYGT